MSGVAEFRRGLLTIPLFRIHFFVRNEFMSLTFWEFLEERAQKVSPQYCPLCRRPVAQDHTMVKRYVDGKRVHEDCYFDNLSAEIGEDPG